MLVEQAQLDQINSKIRRRTLELPYRHGKRCPLRAKRVYRLRGRVPYGRYLLEAYAKPTPARSVLWLIEQCEIPAKSIIITVTEVERQDERWLIHFNKGDQSDYLDRPRLLAARPGREGDYEGDYVTEPARAMRGEPEAVGDSTLRIYQEQSSQALRSLHSASISEGCGRIRAHIAEIREFAPNPSEVAGQLRGLERQLSSLERRLSA